MFWLFRRKDYHYLSPPFGKSIYDLTAEETADYFDWYMQALPQRVAYVSEVCAAELGISRDKLDLSPESLILLWKWFRRRAKTQPRPIPANPKQKALTHETELLLRDVGMYLGETLRKNVSGLTWLYYTEPKNDFFANHPLLKGFVDMSAGKPFYAVFEPIHMAGVQACKLLRHESSNYDLYNLYCLWAEKEPK